MCSFSFTWQGNDRVMEMLLFYGASCDHACKQGATALGISAQEGHEKCVSILLQYGANPNKSDLCGRTPIKLAMKSNNYSILRLLENTLKSMFQSRFCLLRTFPRHLALTITIFPFSDEGLKQQKQRNAAHKILQSPPEKKTPNVCLRSFWIRFYFFCQILMKIFCVIFSRERFSMKTPCDQMHHRIMPNSIGKALFLVTQLAAAIMR